MIKERLQGAEAEEVLRRLRDAAEIFHELRGRAYDEEHLKDRILTLSNELERVRESRDNARRLAKKWREIALNLTGSLKTEDNYFPWEAVPVKDDNGEVLYFVLPKEQD